MPRKRTRRVRFDEATLARLYIEIIDAFGKRPVDARRLDVEDEPGTVLYGCREPGRITIDEDVHVVETHIHETIHEVRPRWTEARVCAAEKAIFGTLTRDQIDALATIYHRVRRPRKSPKVV